ncbi:MT-A70 family methyltransferase [Frigidibacter oleivorans]|uniref:MT-A70 family methyltransferase n=1 Tax=Frigidibacter oleivorans TaxID=2487129 RepID=UPI00197AD58D|nr:MT-A70 family methyltransferase [Frigidibacter oleivorans]
MMVSIAQEWAELRPLGGFTMIVADPPWRMETWSEKGKTIKGAPGQYQCQSLDWIAALPVQILAAEDCILWLWATNPMIPHALEVMEAWGFCFKTAGHWSKKTARGKQAFGTGYILRCAGEPFLIGTRGAPKTSRSVRSVIEAPVREHSRKPDEAFVEAARLQPDHLYPGGVRRVELFSRQRRPGWSVWGNQVSRFEAAHQAAPGPAPFADGLFAGGA